VCKGVADDCPSYRRKYPRLSQSFTARARLLYGSAQLSGITHDLTPSGVFIFNPSWCDFLVDDEREIILFLPPEFTGQNETLILKGLGAVRRFDSDRWAISYRVPESVKNI
jgi:hypothetical protein